MNALAHSNPSASDNAGRWLRATLADDAQLSADSRQVQPGDGFLAFPGLSTDGRRYIDAAIDAGAKAVLLHGHDSNPDTRVPSRCLANLRESAGQVSSAFYDHPSDAMSVTAITGTNGKTSCAHWLAAGLSASGGRSAALGTLGVSRFENGQAHPVADSNDADPANLTTADAVSMQRRLADLRRWGVTAVALEASSIGLDQHRLAGTQIDVAIFCNVSRDHLDYHGDMLAYAKAKQRLFELSSLRVAIVNGDDVLADQMMAATGSAVSRMAFGFARHYQGASDVSYARIAELKADEIGLVMTVDGDFGTASARLNVLGQFNAQNALAVALAWHSLGEPFDQAIARLEGLQPVPGRLQWLQVAQQPLVVIDYAHTPAALTAALQALRPVSVARGGKIWVVFGCGGDRDAGKRPLMAAAAQNAADCLVLTSDNPRSEPAQAIIDQMLEGLSDQAVLVEVDRQLAIKKTIDMAAAADLILIAGKGHECYQEINGVSRPFSDIGVAQHCLARVTS